MDIKEFVENILSQIDESLKNASSLSTESRFDFNYSEGINFDLAVTHTNNKSGEAGAKIKSGIKVIDFDIGGKGNLSTGQELAQRIKFKVMPHAKHEQGSAVVNPNPPGGSRPYFSFDQQY